jgi:hypothetical protein
LYPFKEANLKNQMTRLNESSLLGTIPTTLLNN